MDNFTLAVESVERDIVSAEAELRMLSSQAKSLSDKSKVLAEESTRIGDGIGLVQIFSDSIKSGVISQFEELLTRGVREIFSKDYSISIEFEAHGNTMHADFFAVLPDGKKVNLANGEGGGLRDLVSVLQRILYLVLEPSVPAKFVFFDENLKHLDSARASKAFRFLSNVLKELNIQTIWITHLEGADSDDGGAKLISLGDRNASVIQ